MGDSITPYYDPILDKIRSIDNDADGGVAFDPYLERLRAKDVGSGVKFDPLLNAVRQSAVAVSAPSILSATVELDEEGMAVFSGTIVTGRLSTTVKIMWGETEESLTNEINAGTITEDGGITKSVDVNTFPTGTIYWKMVATNNSGSDQSDVQGALLNQNEPEIDAYIAGLTTPLSSAQIGKLNTFVAALKTGLSISALSDAFDVMYILAGETAESSLKNIVKDAHHATAVNSPDFTALEGFTGNGTTSYINSNYNPSTIAVNYKLNDASFGIYTRLSLAEDKCQIGLTYAAAYTDMFVRLQTNKFSCRINSYTTQSIVANSDSRGLFIVSRPASNSGVIYRNKAASPFAVNSTAIPVGNFTILSRGQSNYSANQASFAFFGKSLTQSQVNSLTDAIEAYMDSNGKGVIA